MRRIYNTMAYMEGDEITDIYNGIMDKKIGNWDDEFDTWEDL